MCTKSLNRPQDIKRIQRSSGKGMEHIPPVAFPVGMKDIFAGLSAALMPRDVNDRFADKIGQSTDAKYCYLVGSGRAAVKLALMSIKGRGESRKVVIPAYTCSTVLQSVLTANLEPLIVDISFETLDYEPEQLQRALDEKPLAVIGVHLYGLPNDFSQLAAFCRQNRIVLIEDAAQAFGALVRGKVVGNQGDIGIYSLGQGKCLPTGGGGVIVTSQELFEVIQSQLENAQILDPHRGFSQLAKMLAYWLLVNQRGWWIVNHTSLNPAGAGADFEELPEIKPTPFSNYQAGLGLKLISKAAQVYPQWRANAERLQDCLSDFKFITIPQTAPDCQPVYLRYPIVLDSPERRERVFVKLNKAGIGVSKSYTFTLPQLTEKNDKNGSRKFPGAVRLATCLLTLPVNHYLNQSAVDTIKSVFESERGE